MFICIGENENIAESIGHGETVAQAIKAWAYNDDWRDIEQEFANYEPTIIEGKPVNVSITIPEPVPVITIHN